MSWRPKDWVNQRNRYLKQNQPLKPYYKTRQKDYEAGADAILEALCTKDNYVSWEENVLGDKLQRFGGWIVEIPEEDNENKD